MAISNLRQMVSVSTVRKQREEKKWSRVTKFKACPRLPTSSTGAPSLGLCPAAHQAFKLMSLWGHLPCRPYSSCYSMGHLNMVLNIPSGSPSSPLTTSVIHQVHQTIQLQLYVCVSVFEIITYIYLYLSQYATSQPVKPLVISFCFLSVSSSRKQNEGSHITEFLRELHGLIFVTHIITTPTVFTIIIKYFQYHLHKFQISAHKNKHWFRRDFANPSSRHTNLSGTRAQSTTHLVLEERGSVEKQVHREMSDSSRSEAERTMCQLLNKQRLRSKTCLQGLAFPGMQLCI